MHKSVWLFFFYSKQEVHMNYTDKNGNEIKAGMKILMDDGSIEEVFATMD